MKRILLILTSLLFLFVSCMNTDNSRIELIKQTECENYYLVILENGDQYYGTVNKWCEYPGGESLFMDSERSIDRLNSLIYRHEMSHESINIDDGIVEIIENTKTKLVSKKLLDYPKISFIEITNINKGHIIEISETEKYYRLWADGPVYNYNTEKQTSKEVDEKITKVLMDYRVNAAKIRKNSFIKDVKIKKGDELFNEQKTNIQELN